jgi:hypothetical protein
MGGDRVLEPPDPPAPCGQCPPARRPGPAGRSRRCSRAPRLPAPPPRRPGPAHPRPGRACGRAPLARIVTCRGRRDPRARHARSGRPAPLGSGQLTCPFLPRPMQAGAAARPSTAAATSSTPSATWSKKTSAGGRCRRFPPWPTGVRLPGQLVGIPRH